VPEADVFLRVEHLSHAFGGFKAVDDCTFEIARGSISALIGPNGAGKSTAVGLIAGALKVRPLDMEGQAARSEWCTATS
jgi:ABC-type branched-subunit amino acid transport system ATPase component